MAVKCQRRTVVSENKSFDSVILTWRVISRGLKTTTRWEKMFVGSISIVCSTCPLFVCSAIASFFQSSDEESGGEDGEKFATQK